MIYDIRDHQLLFHLRKIGKKGFVGIRLHSDIRGVCKYGTFIHTFDQLPFVSQIIHPHLALGVIVYPVGKAFRLRHRPLTDENAYLLYSVYGSLRYNRLRGSAHAEDRHLLSDDIYIRILKGSHVSCTIGRVAGKAPVFVYNSICRPTYPCTEGELIHKFKHSLLVRHCKIKASDIAAFKSLYGTYEIFRQDIKCQINIVKPQQGKRHIVHGRGYGMLHRMSQKRGKPCFSVYIHLKFSSNFFSKAIRRGIFYNKRSIFTSSK